MHTFPLRATPTVTDYYDHAIRPAPPPPPPSRPAPPPLRLSQQPTTTTTTSNDDTMMDLTTYCHTWEDIITVEWHDILMKYERFSQYNKTVTVVSATTTTAALATTCTAVISIPGIADASAPSLQIGDVVLLRPLYPIALPQSPPQQQLHSVPLAQLPWSPPHHTIEIQATVLTIQRAPTANPNRRTGTSADTVHISWLHPHESAMILYAIQQQQQQQQYQQPSSMNRSHRYDRDTNHAAFHIRFVPSYTTMQRYGTALDSFRHFHHNDGGGPSARDSRPPVDDNNNDDDDDDDNEAQDLDYRSNYSYCTGETTTDDDDDSHKDQYDGNYVDDDDEVVLPDHDVVEDTPTLHTQRHETSAAAAIMELLFPTTAPSDLTLTMTTTTIVPTPLTEQLSELAIHDSSNSNTGSRTPFRIPDSMNHKQQSFIRILQTRTQQPSYGSIRGPLILTGPAGTGKTKTLLCALHVVLNDDPSHHRVLVCTPSHTASDVITRRLSQHLTRQQLFRLYGSDRPLATVPVEVLKHCYQADDGTFGIPDVAMLMKFQVIVCTCSDAHLLYRIGLTNQQLRIRRQCYESYIRKCCEGTNLNVQINGVQDPHFTHLFIDEAAQATEPETLIPLSLVMDPIGAHRKMETALVFDGGHDAATRLITAGTIAATAGQLLRRWSL